MSTPSDIIAGFASQLIDEGKCLLETQYEQRTSSITVHDFVDLQEFHRWCASCRLLIQQLGQFAEPWRHVLGEEKQSSYATTVESMIGALKSVHENALNGRLARFEDIVFSEALANLIEQGEYLLEKGYHLAAGVIFRAVLEERLRRLCEIYDEMPDKERATVADYNQKLYKARVYDKIAMKHVDAMAAIGNASAHCTDELDVTRVAQLHSNLVDFLAKNSIV